MKINPIVCDLSHYQSVTDWAKVKAWGIRGVIHKATEGVSITDSRYAQREIPARSLGLLWGAYHFLRPGNIAAQAEKFLSVVGKTDPTVLMALDHEDPQVSLTDALAWAKIVHDATRRWPILYSGFLIKEQLVKTPVPIPMRLWLAQYSASPSWPKQWNKPFLWQFTGDGAGPAPHSVDGITPGNIDIDSFDGTPEQLTTQWTDGALVPSPIVVTTIPDNTPTPSPVIEPQLTWWQRFVRWLSS